MADMKGKKRKAEGHPGPSSEKKQKADRNQGSSAQLITVPDSWKEPKFTPNDNPHGMLAESSFTLKFPRYREKYLRERWPVVKKKMSELNLRAELDLLEGTVTVLTTRKTWDPYAIINARDCIKLLGRSVPLEQALRVLEDGIACDVIKIRRLVRNDACFIKRRQRLVGPDGSTLKAMEVLLECYIQVQGGTVSAVGPYKGLKIVRKIVENCMNNIHPVRMIRHLLAKNNLAKNKSLSHKSWDHMLPGWKSQNVKRKVPKKVKRKKEYTPFPPPQLERKVDRELATGEYFLKQKEKTNPKKQEKSQKKKEEKERRRRQSFIPPKEN